MGRPKSEEPKSNVIAVRLSDAQLRRLKTYMQIKRITSEAEAVRRLIDGLSDWISGRSKDSITNEIMILELDSIETKLRDVKTWMRAQPQQGIVSPVTSHQLTEVVHNGPPKMNDVTEADVTETDESRPVVEQSKTLRVVGKRTIVDLPGEEADYDSTGESSNRPSMSNE